MREPHADPRARLGAWLRSPAGVLAACVIVIATACTNQPLTWAEVDRRIAEVFPEVSHITTQELADRLADHGSPVLLLDARTAEEYEVSHLPGATHAPTVARALAAVRDAPSDATVVVYCSVGYRSANLAADLKAAGQARVVNLQGSLFAWANERRPLVHAELPAKQVHPYDATWGALLDRALWSFDPGSP